MAQSTADVHAEIRAAVERDRHMFENVRLSAHLQNAMRKAAREIAAERSAA